MAIPVPRTSVSCFSLRSEQLAALEADGAAHLRGPGQKAHGCQRGDGLARTRLSDDAQHLAGGQSEVDPPHRVHDAVLCPEVDLEMFDL